MVELDVERFVPQELHSRPGAVVGGLALAAGVAMGIAMGMKMRGGATRVERRVEDYRGAWHQLRGR
ncbi:MAG: hypothetical protein WD557_11410 [Dehalococcoidia bacterium]